MKCSICKNKIDCRYGHNAAPVNDGRCCSFCNDRIVIPARLTLIFGRDHRTVKKMTKLLSDFGDGKILNTYEETIKAFLAEDSSRQIIIRNHVGGYRVTIRQDEYGEVSFSTKNSHGRWPYPHMVIDCMKNYNSNIKKRESERIESLRKRKSEIQKELEEVSEELKNITLKTFVDDHNN